MNNTAGSPPITIDDIFQNPRKYGAPTFEEFCAGKGKQRKDQQMIALVDGPQNFRKDLKKIRFFVHGKPLPTEESVEQMLLDHGFTLEDIDLENKRNRLPKRINLVDVGGGLEHEIHVNFLP